ncbi:hypothetical protein IE81DRAFT_324570 [Ceraceosorus guamensis]|uniref:Glycerophosphocholine acyltransferase 1 n=1 Tax=Ceraceosorus guamensis TaxID=1522189 RepID=A0A316VVC4_9BASI|nr:hypothetical protein IE81DRAFT_324570 [Ceraceosorus guamensis]PWN41430.1 hypothetical protein IE81DRAFT_324570 [Ceraceosorus guamensis]
MSHASNKGIPVPVGSDQPSQPHNDSYSGDYRPILSRTQSSTSASSTSRRNSLEIDGIDITSGLPTAGLPLSDLLQTYLAPRLDLFDRRLRKYGDDIRRRSKYDELVRRSRDKKEELGMRQELKKLRGKVATRVDTLQTRWKDAKTVRLRDKVCFVIGVMNLVATSLIWAQAPEWIPLFYSAQLLYFLPLRVYTYTKRKWHYFLFDFCYYANLLNLAFLWIFPHSRWLWTVCYCAAHGPLAFSIATWRNSAVFHSLEKMCSLFIHIYPPLVFMTIRHHIPKGIAERMYPALVGLDNLDFVPVFFANLLCYLVWQFLYYEFIIIGKKEKVRSGERINSYSTLATGKGAIANLLGKASEGQRETAFMLLQCVYTIVCTLPAPLIFYKSARWSSIFLLTLLVLSLWNGASYLVEVTFRRFEKELEKLRLEVQQAQEYALALDSEESRSTAHTNTNTNANASRRSSREVKLDDLQSAEIRKNV